MQKKLLAVAVLATVSGTAFAQSANVTLYGRWKMNLEATRAGGSSNPAVANGGGFNGAGAAVAGDNSGSSTRFQNGSSMLGFRGTEDLGNGLRAEFQVETDVGGDNINQGGGKFSNRDSYVGLGSNSWGSVRMGHWDTYFITVDRFGEGATANAWSQGHSNLTILNRSQTVTSTAYHISNAIQYLTPNWNGFTGKLQYSTNGVNDERGGNWIPSANAGTPAVGNAKNWFADIYWANGPWNAGFSYFNIKNTFSSATAVVTVQGTQAPVFFGQGLTAAGGAVPAGVQQADVTAYRLGGSYTFAMGIKLGLIWDKLKNTTVPTAAGVTLDQSRSAWAIPVSYRTGNHLVSFTYAHAGTTSNVAASATGATDTAANFYSLGYDYSFSKRTSIGAQYSAIRNHSNASYDFWSRGIAGAATPAGALAVGQSVGMLSVGMKHLF